MFITLIYLNLEGILIFKSFPSDRKLPKLVIPPIYLLKSISFLIDAKFHFFASIQLINSLKIKKNKFILLFSRVSRWSVCFFRLLVK